MHIHAHAHTLSWLWRAPAIMFSAGSIEELSPPTQAENSWDAVVKLCVCACVLAASSGSAASPVRPSLFLLS